MITKTNLYKKFGKLNDKEKYIALQMLDNKSGMVAEHRMIMAFSIGRPLKKYEEVHHRNGNNKDNRRRNLKLKIKSKHQCTHGRNISEWNDNDFRKLAVEKYKISKTIRKLIIKNEYGYDFSGLAKKLGVTRQYIHQVMVMNIKPSAVFINKLIGLGIIKNGDGLIL